MGIAGRIRRMALPKWAIPAAQNVVVRTAIESRSRLSDPALPNIRPANVSAGDACYSPARLLLSPLALVESRIGFDASHRHRAGRLDAS